MTAHNENQITSEPNKTLHPRAARKRLAVAHDYLCHLELALRAGRILGYGTENLNSEISRVSQEIPKLERRKGERIEPRRRVPTVQRNQSSPPRAEYLMFIDECGSHPLFQPNDPFPVFCLCGVIVDRDTYPVFERIWKTWKAEFIGGPAQLVHEPDVRRRSRHFYSADPVKQEEILKSLESTLASMEYSIVAAAIDKRAYHSLHGTSGVDDFLPASAYLMCVDFVIERFVHFLYYQGNDARGSVIAESRGAREDAEVHAEFIRLLLEGTQWQADGWFRNQLRPYVEFIKKDQNSSAMQVADLAARPIAEKVLQPDKMPERWHVFRPRLYDGCQGRPMSYGLKIYPSPNEEIGD